MIHETAIVSPDARLDRDVEIGPYAILESDVEIGEGSRVEAHAILKSGSVIGDWVTIGSFCVIAGPPQDLSFDETLKTYVIIGDRTTVREGSTINRATREGEATKVGADCFLMAVTHLGHDCEIGNHVVIGNNSLLGGFVTVGDNAFLGGNSGIHQFCRIGEGVMLGGDCTVTVDVPPYTMLAERNTLFGFNLVGLRRRGHPKEAIKALKECYAAIFNDEGSHKEIIQKLLKSDAVQHSECRAFLEFFVGGKRGFAQPRKDRISES